MKRWLHKVRKKYSKPTPTDMACIASCTYIPKVDHLWINHCWFAQSDTNTSTHHNMWAWFILPKLLLDCEKQWQLVCQTWTLKGFVSTRLRDFAIDVRKYCKCGNPLPVHSESLSINLKTAVNGTTINSSTATWTVPPISCARICPPHTTSNPWSNKKIAIYSLSYATGRGLATSD